MKGGDNLNNKVEKKFYSTKETALELGYTRQTILNWINSGHIKAIKGNEQYRVPASEIERIKNGN